jgi:hypothetical protein
VVDVFEADVGAGEGEHGFVDVGAVGVSAGEVAVGVQPGDRSLDHPAVASETGPVAAVAFGVVGRYPAFSQFAAVALGVVGSVGVNAAWPELAVAACGRHAIHELDELRDGWRPSA